MNLLRKYKCVFCWWNSNDYMKPFPNIFLPYTAIINFETKFKFVLLSFLRCLQLNFNRKRFRKFLSANDEAGGYFIRTEFNIHVPNGNYSFIDFV